MMTAIYQPTITLTLTDAYSFRWSERKRKYVELIQDGGQIKREKDIFYHGPRLRGWIE
jgi:hypothetical protein